MRVLWTRLTFYLVTSISFGLGTLAWTAGNSLDQVALKVSAALLTFGALGWMLNLLILGSSLNTVEPQRASAVGDRSGNADVAAETADDTGEGADHEGQATEETASETTTGEPA